MSNMTCVLSFEHVGDGRRVAAIRHVQHVDAGHHLEQLAGKMRRRADAAGRHVELARICLGVGDQFRNRFDRHLDGFTTRIAGSDAMPPIGARSRLNEKPTPGLITALMTFGLASISSV